MTEPTEPELLLLNARIVTERQPILRGSLLVKSGRIERIFNDKAAPSIRSAAQIDLDGATLFPGFIDVHIHGAVGVDTLEASPADLDRVSQFLATMGVTAWLPTLVPASDAQYRHAVDTLSASMKNQTPDWDRGRPARSAASTANIEGTDGERAGPPRTQSQPPARVLGVHYEGPFVSDAQCGALQVEHFRTYSDPTDVAALPTPVCDGAVRMITVAPEISGGVELVRELTRQGWVVSIGHTRATVSVLDEAAQAGAHHMTHFMNAMPPLHHRSPGPVGWGLSRDDVTCDLIADGIHLDPLMLRLLLKMKSPTRLTLISDAIAATGLGDGDYQIWGETISVAEGRTRNARGSIAGAVITMLDAVRMMLKLGVDETDVARMASANPARLLGIETVCGSIEQGKRADLAALDNEGNVKLTIIGGEIAFGPE